MKKKEPKLPLFKRLEEAGTEMEKAINKSDYLPGQAVYTMFGAID